MSGAVRGALLHAPLPSLRRKLASTPGELNPVPPLAAGTMSRAMFGVVVGFFTTNGLLALMPVTPPLPWGTVSPLGATIVQSAPSIGVTFTLSLKARHDEPLKLTASSATKCVAASHAPFQFSPLGPWGPAGPCSPVAPVGP